MKSIYIPDVGDGLAIGIKTVGGESIQIDCGSQQGCTEPYNKGLCANNPDIFILSHFHSDHYNGLFPGLKEEPNKKFRITHAYYPRLPKFEQRDDFLRCLFAMASFTMGDKSGSIEMDCLNLLNGINKNGNRVKIQALSKGDNVSTTGGLNFEILWPPKTMSDDKTQRVVKNAINDFHNARNGNKTLDKLYNAISQETLNKYKDNDLIKCHEVDISCEKKKEEKTAKDDPIVKLANKSLRRAANHFSLAFCVDKRFLFLGDLENTEIKDVFQHLQAKNNLKFHVMIAPHHGTHRVPKLSEFCCSFAICSAGPRLIRYIDPGLKDISKSCWIPYLNGDLTILLKK